MTPRKILVPIELEDAASRVLDYAASLAVALGAKLHVVHAFAQPLIGSEVPIVLSATTADQLTAQVRERLEQLVASHVEPALRGEIAVEVGDPRTVIAEAARELGVDLIVMGTHGRRGLARLVMGSVAESVARAAHCPVLLYREP
jgi:universal stress protein A